MEKAPVEFGDEWGLRFTVNNQSADGWSSESGGESFGTRNEYAFAKEGSYNPIFKYNYHLLIDQDGERERRAFVSSACTDFGNPRILSLVLCGVVRL